MLTEFQQKIMHFHALCQAVECARTNGVLVERPSGRTHYVYTEKQAQELQQCKEARDEFRALLPKLQIVSAVA